MVCPDKKPKGKLHVYFNGKDMGEVEPYIQTDETSQMFIINIIGGSLECQTN